MCGVGVSCFFLSSPHTRAFGLKLEGVVLYLGVGLFRENVWEFYSVKRFSVYKCMSRFERVDLHCEPSQYGIGADLYLRKTAR